MEVATYNQFQMNSFLQPKSLRIFGVEIHLDDSPKIHSPPYSARSSFEIVDSVSNSPSCSSCSEESEDNQSDDEFMETAVQTLACLSMQRIGERGSFSESYVPPIDRRPSPIKKSSSTDDCWDRSYQELVEFYRRHGHATVTGKKYYSLANWVRKQRSCRKSGKLSHDKIAKLNALGFEWDRTYFFKKGEM